MIRLNKYIARAGICSRRKADDLIADGRVKVNSKVVTQLGTKIDPSDEVEVNGESIERGRRTYVLLNKPLDVITTTDDEHGRKTVMDLLSLSEEKSAGLFPVGRLDRDTTGALVITNDGNLGHRLMHPRYEIEKFYRVRTAAAVKPHEIEMLRAGVELEDGMAAADKAAYLDGRNRNEIGIALHEGRNRQVRRMVAAVGHEVVELERVQYAGLTTHDLEQGAWRELSDKEVKRLYRVVGLKKRTN